MFLLAGCIESVAVIGGGAANGKVIQSSIQSGLSYGIKKETGKTPMGHILFLSNENKSSEKKDSCSSFSNKKNKELCLMVEKKIISNQAKIKEKNFIDKTLNELTLTLRSSIDKKSKIKYLD